MGNCFRPGLPPEREQERETEHEIYESNEFWSFREDCCICMENPVQTAILNCGHLYHSKCIDEWFLKKNECPICRIQ